MLLKLVREEKPDYIAGIFQDREKTFRHETFADYKANRTPDARRSGEANSLHFQALRSALTSR